MSTAEASSRTAHSAPAPPGAALVEAFRDLGVTHGVVHALLTYDVGFSIDLAASERSLTAGASQRKTLRAGRQAPTYFEFDPPPLRVTQIGPPIEAAGFATEAAVETVLYDFGAVSVTYRFQVEQGLGRLSALAEALYDNKALLADSRRRVEELFGVLKPCIAQPCVADVVEDYVIYELSGAAPADELAERVRAHAGLVARLLRAEAERLSEQEVQDALACQVSYTRDDLVLVDWNAALMLGTGAEDVRAVLEFANVQLLELRFLDDRLDSDLDAAYALLARKRWGLLGREARATFARVARMRIDSAILNEGVNNALKLLGDQFLARVYRLASQRLHLPAWQANIQRKLEVLESISNRVGEERSARRIEVLEWIIIVLILIEIIMPGLRLLWP